jgi:hypothetical protein
MLLLSYRSDFISSITAKSNKVPKSCLGVKGKGYPSCFVYAEPVHCCSIITREGNEVRFVLHGPATGSALQSLLYYAAENAKKSLSSTNI